MTSLLARAQHATLAAVYALPTLVQRRIAGRPVVIDGNELNLETQLMLRLQELTRDRGPGHFPIPQGRRVMAQQAAVVGGTPSVAHVEDISLGGLGARRYVPAALQRAAVRPTLVFFHGGGFIYGDLESHDAPCRFLAERADVQVIAVDYRLAPEAVAPAAAHDCIAAHEWVVAHAEELQVDVHRIAVGGDSAGGNLATVTARVAAERGTPLAFQLLVYPVTDLGSDTESKRLFGTGFYLDTEFLDLARVSYAPTPELLTHPWVSPLLHDVPQGLAPAYLCTAGFDPLRDEGEAYAEKLRAAGATVEHRRFDDEIHGFFNVVGVGSSSRTHVGEIADALRKGLSA